MKKRLLIAAPLLLAGIVLVVFALLVGAGSPVAAAEDGRVNCHAASPVVIYCTDDGIIVLDIHGQELLRISDDVLDEAVVPAEGEVTVLGENADGSLKIYLLSNGQYLVAYINAAPDELYLVFWTGCGPGTAGTGDIKVYDIATGEMLSDADGCGRDGCASSEVCDQTCWNEMFPPDCDMYMGCPEARAALCCYDSCDGPSACLACLQSNPPPSLVCMAVCGMRKGATTNGVTAIGG